MIATASAGMRGVISAFAVLYALGAVAALSHVHDCRTCAPRPCVVTVVVALVFAVGAAVFTGLFASAG